MTAGKPLKAAVLGHPVAQSLSPKLHGYWLERYGIAGSYEAIDTPPEQLAKTLAWMQAEGYAGCNLTVPLKEAVLPLLDEIDPVAAAIGAVNTVVFRNGRMVGYNTDAYGFMRNISRQSSVVSRQYGQGPHNEASQEANPLVERSALGLSRETVVQRGSNYNHCIILGAGGAARAVVAGLIDAGARRITLLNRSLEKAQALVNAFSHYPLTRHFVPPSPPRGEEFLFPLPLGERGRVRGITERKYKTQNQDFAKKLRKDQTEVEKKLWLKIRNRQIANAKFRRQQLIGPYIADFVCQDLRLIIELDGGQHCDSMTDIQRDAYTKAEGYRTLRFWNSDVYENIDGVLQVIWDAIHMTSPEGLGEGKIHALPWQQRHEALSEATLLVNTTSLGMIGQPPLEITLDALPLHALVTDIVYKPLETALLKQARERGNPSVDGLGMLLYQAEPAFEHFFGIRPEVTAKLRDYIVSG